MIIKNIKKRSFSLFALVGLTSILNATVPNSPGEPSFTYIDDATVRISFPDNSDNEYGFKLYVNNGVGTERTWSSNNSKYAYKTLKRLSCNKTYTVAVSAYNSDGESEKSDERSFTFQGTFGKPCSPVVKIDTGEKKYVTLSTKDILTHSINSSIHPFISNFGELVSCSWKLNGKSSYGISCEELKKNDYFSLSNITYSLNVGDNNLTLTVTDSNGVSATDSLLIKVIDNTTEGIYLYEGNMTMKVGQTIFIEAGLEKIYDNWGQLSSSHSWDDSNVLGTFNDNMFETGHVFPGQGYTASTTYTAKNEGNTTLTLYGNGGSKSINVQIVAPNRVVIDDNLMWQDNHHEVTKPWSINPNDDSSNTSGDTAETYCSNLNWANYSDWRIPTIEELLSYISFDNDKEYWGSVKYQYSYSKFGRKVTSSSLRYVGNDEELLVKCVRDIKK